MADQLEKSSPEFHEVLDKLHSGAGGQDSDVLNKHLSRDSEVPEVHNGAALAAHRRNHDNSGAYVILHGAGMPPQAVGKAMAASAEPEARLFRHGGPVFASWHNDAPEAEAFVQKMQTLIPGMVSGAGSDFGRAMGAFKSGGGGDERHSSYLGVKPVAGWRKGHDSVKDARQKGLETPLHGDDVQGVPGHQTLFAHQHAEEPLAKNEISKHPGLQHPIFSGRPFAILSGENPRFAHVATGHDAMRSVLQARGYPHEEIQGFYDKPERSFIVYDIPGHEARQLGRDFGQESVIHGGGPDGPPVMSYTNGEHADHYHPSKGYNFWNKPPANYWSRIGPPEAPLYFNIDFDWNQKLPLKQPLGAKSPHSYPWHEGHTMHNGPEPGDEPLSKANNDQAAGAGVSTFGTTTAPWGEVKPGVAPSLRHYDFRPHEAAIDEMAAKHGYQFNMMGGKHGKPDLANKNFNTRHINIWDPSEGSGGDFGEEAYTRSWRKAHELAHALTYGDINTKWGEGRRIGKLGYHRTPHEAKRAIAWEDAAVNKQREIAASLGHHISDEDFHRERNNVIADATHRAIFGTFTEPSAEGFHPHPHEVPIKTAFDTVDRHAQQMGLGEHETLKTKGQVK